MKFGFLFFILTITFADTGCRSRKAVSPATNCFKGKLEIKAACMNYTISVVEGNMDSSMIAASWTDENTNISYNNVFALASPCNFPKEINQGDTFYFTIDTTTKQDCAVCLLYYPVPPKSLSISVHTTPCNN